MSRGVRRLMMNKQRSLSGHAAAALLFALGSTIGRAAPASAGQDEPPPASAPEGDAQKREARALFLRGVELFREGAVEAALAAFLRSRELFPTRNATDNAAICLRALGRFVEALAMVEALLNEFPDLPPEIRASAEQTRAELLARVGVISLSGGEPEAVVLIDGKAQGSFPLAGPIRVSAGTHVVRIYKPRYLPFEATVTVAGGAEKQIAVKMLPLMRSGQLQVVEASGAVVDVIVDGIKVGQTPWTGALSVGTHTVTLRGDATRGTQPHAAVVTSGKTRVLSLTLETLPCELRIEVDPSDASVLLDDVPLPLGTWEGPVRAGAHKIEAFSVGHLDLIRRINLEPSSKQNIRLKLERKGYEAQEPRGYLFVEVGAAAALSPTLGGDMVEACEVLQCEASVVAGGALWVRAGYRLPSGVDLGLSLGYLGLRQTLSNRIAATSTPVSYPPSRTLRVNDELAVHGLLVGASVAYTTKWRYPVTLRLGGGVAPSWVGDQRTGPETNDLPLGLVPAYESTSALFAYLAPGLFVGAKIDPRLDIFFGADVLLLFPLSRPAWDPRHEVAFGTDIFAFPSETMVGSAVAVVTPGISARYTFR